MIDKNLKIILASKSPRRKELMHYISDNFEIIPSDAEEIIPEGVDLEDVPEILATQKASSLDIKNKLIIGCDTVVICNGEIFGKPKDERDAYRMISSLSDNTHAVISGVCIKYDELILSFSEKTDVTFYALSDEEIREYLNEENVYDKAGAYGIQGKAGTFVKEIHGDFYNVVGFPIAKLKRELTRFIEENNIKA